MDAEPPSAALSPGTGEHGRRLRDGVVWIDSLRDGDRVAGLMACVRKAILTKSSNGQAFLAAILRDGSTTIAARAFQLLREDTPLAVLSAALGHSAPWITARHLRRLAARTGSRPVANEPGGGE